MDLFVRDVITPMKDFRRDSLVRSGLHNRDEGLYTRLACSYGTS
nr:hypothetical protein [Fredinandcohnia onubensis]